MSQANIKRNSDKANPSESDEEDEYKDEYRSGKRIVIGCVAGAVLLAVPVIAVIESFRHPSSRRGVPSSQTGQQRPPPPPKRRGSQSQPVNEGPNANQDGATEGNRPAVTNPQPPTGTGATVTPGEVKPPSGQSKEQRPGGVEGYMEDLSHPEKSAPPALKPAAPPAPQPAAPPAPKPAVPPAPRPGAGATVPPVQVKPVPVQKPQRPSGIRAYMDDLENPGPVSPPAVTNIQPQISAGAKVPPVQVKPTPTRTPWQRPSGIQGYMDDLMNPDL